MCEQHACLLLKILYCNWRFANHTNSLAARLMPGEDLSPYFKIIVCSIFPTILASVLRLKTQHTITIGNTHYPHNEAHKLLACLHFWTNFEAAGLLLVGSMVVVIHHSNKARREGTIHDPGFAGPLHFNMHWCFAPSFGQQRVKILCKASFACHFHGLPNKRLDVLFCSIWLVVCILCKSWKILLEATCSLNYPTFGLQHACQFSRIVRETPKIWFFLLIVWMLSQISCEVATTTTRLFFLFLFFFRKVAAEKSFLLRQFGHYFEQIYSEKFLKLAKSATARSRRS